MKITQHGFERIKTRGISADIIDLVNYLLPPEFKRGANFRLMTRKKAKYLSSGLRKMANIIERSAGVELIQSGCDSTLITAYRKKGRKI